MKLTRPILFVIGAMAVVGSILGYSGVFTTITRESYYDQRLELLRIIDTAQLWHSRPVAYGGGGRSFIELDFKRLGFADKVGSITFNGEYATYYLDGISATEFDLRSVSPGGYVIQVRDVTYDQRPELLITRSKLP